MRPARVVDAALEATVVGGFSRIGYAVRSRLGDWDTRFDLTGTRVLITGGTSGIGLAAACTMAGSGASVAITGRDQRRLDHAVSQLADRGTPVVAVRADASDLEASVTMLEQVLHALGGVDVLVHNAGALTHRHTTSPQGFELTYAVHVLSPFVLTAHALPSLGTTGHVITVSSGGMYTQRLEPHAVQMGAADFDGVAAYARAKRAQVALTEQWARTHPRGPVFAAMHPGWADTPGVQDSLPGFRRLTGPILRTPQQGADTISWLAAAEVPSGLFWLDRTPRSTRRLPRTGHTDADAQTLFATVREEVREFLPEGWR
jgi:NAD(P)-dependent dehydrogenase (short-subunit alcohol dehydrogenase family)